MKGVVWAFVCGGVVAFASPACAKVLRLTCQDGSYKYDISYDTTRRTLATTHRDFTKPITIEKTQETQDGTLIWGTMQLGPASKNVLVQFGREKWAMHFWGYDDKRRDNCV